MGDCFSSKAKVTTSNDEQDQTRSPSPMETSNGPAIGTGEYFEREKKQFEEKYAHPSKQTAKFEDFQLVRTIGLGTCSHVMLVKRDNKLIALKIMEKRNIVEMNNVKNILEEKRILQAINFPFIIGFAYSFKDNSYLYLALEYASGGEMFAHFKNENKYSEDQVRFYAAQIVLAFEYLHYLSSSIYYFILIFFHHQFVAYIIYRNLKVEEILFSADGYLKLADFGLAKVVPEQTFTLCGTSEYLAPEVITGKGYNKSVDYWALGILIFELTAGFPPYKGADSSEIYRMILQGTFDIPNNFSDGMQDLICKLLELDPEKRLGNLPDGTKDIKSHNWFTSIEWINLLEKRIKPEYVPDPDKEHFEKCDEKPMINTDVDLYSIEFEDF